jgi:outer membrane protein, heavy metal efflux system
MKASLLSGLGIVVFVTVPATGAGEQLTLEAALAIAKERAPSLLASRRLIAEAEARERTRPAQRDNPTVEAARGARAPSSNDLDVGVSQTFELGGRGGARRDADHAAVARAVAEAAEAERTVLRDVRIGFLRGLHAGERLRLARSVETDAAELQRVARRRFEAGDIAALEVNVASSALARARAEVKAAQAAQALALTELSVLLDLPPEPTVSLAGELRDDRAYDAVRFLAALDQRPEIRALDAQIREAEAEVRLGRGYAWPDLSPGLRYERDQGDRVIWAGLTITLPLFDRGQQLRAVGRTRVEGLRAEAAARRRVLEVQVRGALVVHDMRAAAVADLALNVETLAESEALARRSYEVGQIGIGELLLLRREVAEARRQWLDSLLELGQVRADLDSLPGGTR